MSFLYNVQHIVFSPIIDELYSFNFAVTYSKNDKGTSEK